MDDSGNEAPVIFDPDIDAMRPVTQADVDWLVDVAASYGRLRAASNKERGALLQKQANRGNPVPKIVL